MQDCNPISTLLPVSFKLSSCMSPNNEADRVEMSWVPYASAMRSLKYVFICTRQDIEQTAGVVSQFVEDPSKEHQNDVDRIMRYNKGTSCVAIWFGGSNLIVRGYVDSDFADDHNKRKSMCSHLQ